MLCCWLHQLQEFGGPEVDPKPDLLKDSHGSLKNVGVHQNNTSSATSTTTSTAPAVATTTMSNIKPNLSTTGSIIKHNSCLDKRARYNVCKLYSRIQIKTPTVHDTHTHKRTHDDEHFVLLSLHLARKHLSFLPMLIYCVR